VAEGGPEESVQGVQYWPRPFPFQDSDLLTEGEDFDGGIAPTAKENRDTVPWLLRADGAESQVADFTTS
jgi:hypothetical protein